METKEITKEKEMMHLADCMASIISQLKEEKKYSAVHTYNSTLNSFKAFSDGDEAKMSIDEVFTAARLKDYEVWDKFISLFYEVLIESEPILEYPFEGADDQPVRV